MGASRDTRDLYDSSAEQWVRSGQKLLSDFTARPRVLDECGSLNGLRILDLGCGEGYMTRHFLERSASEVIGIDVSEAMIRAAKKSVDDGRAKFFVGDLRNGLPVLDGLFDLVAAVFVFNYLSDEEVRDVMSRLLPFVAPEGRVIVTIPHPALPHFTRSRSAIELFHFPAANPYMARSGRAMEGRIQDVDGQVLEVRSIERTIESFLSAVDLKSWRITLFAELGLPDLGYPSRFAPLQGEPLHLLLSLEKSVS